MGSTTGFQRRERNRTHAEAEAIQAWELSHGPTDLYEADREARPTLNGSGRCRWIAGNTPYTIVGLDARANPVLPKRSLGDRARRHSLRREEAVATVRVARAFHVTLVWQARAKPDPIDARRKLAELVRVNLFSAIRVPDLCHAPATSENLVAPGTDLYGKGGSAWLATAAPLAGVAHPNRATTSTASTARRNHRGDRRARCGRQAGDQRPYIGKANKRWLKWILFEIVATLKLAPGPVGTYYRHLKG